MVQSTSESRFLYCPEASYLEHKYAIYPATVATFTSSLRLTLTFKWLNMASALVLATRRTMSVETQKCFQSLSHTHTLSIATCNMMHVDRAVFIYWCELANAMRPL